MRLLTLAGQYQGIISFLPGQLTASVNINSSAIAEKWFEAWTFTNRESVAFLSEATIQISSVKN